MTPEERDEIVRTERECVGLSSAILRFRVHDQASFDQAAEWTRHAKALWSQVEEKRLRITRPLLQAKNEVDAHFKGPKDALFAIERHLKAEMGAYDRAIKLAQVATVRESVAALAQGYTPTAIVPEAPAAPGVTVRQVWDFEIVDPDAVPRDLCSPDPAKIKARIWYADTPHKEPLEIPGVRFFLKESVTVRR